MAHLPARIQLHRSRGWRKPAGAVVVARPSKWGNPIRLDDVAERHPDASPDEAARIMIGEFRELLATPSRRAACGYPSDEQIRRELAGHDLACWCPPERACHADVLLEIANDRRSTG
jgi:hypothetical protein